MQFQLKIGTTALRKSANFVLLRKLLSDLFTGVQIRYLKTFKFGRGRFSER